jgi:hypothetical protein
MVQLARAEYYGKGPFLRELYDAFRGAWDRHAEFARSSPKLLSVPFDIPITHETMRSAWVDLMLATDSAATITLLAAAILERLFRSTGKSTISVGPKLSGSPLFASRSIVLLSNQYKHRGEWQQNLNRPSASDLDDVTSLVGHALRVDAPAAFLATYLPTFDALDQVFSAIFAHFETSFPIGETLGMQLMLSETREISGIEYIAPYHPTS